MAIKNVKEEKLGPAPTQDLSNFYEWQRWFELLSANFPRVRVYTTTINGTTVTANTSDEQTFTVSGITTDDVIVTVVKPTHTSNLTIPNARVSTNGTVALTFLNTAGTNTDPPSESYKLVTIRG